MAGRFCGGIPFQLSSTIIYYGAQLDIRVNFCPSEFARVFLLNYECLNRFSALYGDPEERLWPFVFAMGFIFQQRASQYIININRTCVSKVMVVQICVGIPYQHSSAMIYYGPHSEIRV